MIKQIDVDSFLKPMGQGISRPILVMGSDFNSYILKNQRVDHQGNIVNFDCMFLNELLAYQIGIFLGVPIPEAAIAYVDGEFIERDPKIRFAYRYEEGYYFACAELDDIEDNLRENMQLLKQMGKPHINKPWRKFLKDIDNKEDIAKIIAFDILIGNFDRYTNEGNILVNVTGDLRKISAIDHGHAFWGSMWDMSKMNGLMSPKMDIKYINEFIQFMQFNINGGNLDGLGEIFRALEESIDLADLGNHSFMEVVEKIESITEEYLDKWLNNIPREWFVDRDKQIGLYKNFILKQKDLIRHFIQVLATKKAFANYTGGELKWKQKSQCGTA